MATEINASWAWQRWRGGVSDILRDEVDRLTAEVNPDIPEPAFSATVIQPNAEHQYNALEDFAAELSRLDIGTVIEIDFLGGHPAPHLRQLRAGVIFRRDRVVILNVVGPDEVMVQGTTATLRDLINRNEPWIERIRWARWTLGHLPAFLVGSRLELLDAGQTSRAERSGATTRSIAKYFATAAAGALIYALVNRIF